VIILKVSTDTSASSFGTYYSGVEKDYLTLNSSRSSYSSAAKDITSQLGKADFSGWEDSVSTTMQLAVEDFSKAIGNIETDLSTGNHKY
jgi:hypothetical protein